jgi:PHD/YefM family antitoxin component YafN of YafNO toxin-antitoxin module/mRNA-degrading endonuclease RelE of RelBE toxin-antitoxin system
LIARVTGRHERVHVTVPGKPSAVLVASEDLEAQEETIEILADADTLRRLHAANAALPRGSRHGRTWRRHGAVAPARDGGRDAYDPEITPTAWRQLTERLPESVATAAYDLITGPLLDGPHRVSKGLRPPLDDGHGARRGTYRIDDDSRTVTVSRIALRPIARTADPPTAGFTDGSVLT